MLKVYWIYLKWSLIEVLDLGSGRPDERCLLARLDWSELASVEVSPTGRTEPAQTFDLAQMLRELPRVATRPI